MQSSRNKLRILRNKKVAKVFLEQYTTAAITWKMLYFKQSLKMCGRPRNQTSL